MRVVGDEVFVDGDDTPFSKAILTSAYASRGLKMRVTSGGGAEVLMGAAEKCSILYLESRCVSLARALGSQGVQNGGIDGVGVVLHRDGDDRDGFRPGGCEHCGPLGAFYSCACTENALPGACTSATAPLCRSM